MPESEPLAFVEGMILQIREQISERIPLKKHLTTEGDYAPSDEVVGPPSNLKSWSTTEDDTREPENRNLGYHKIEDIYGTLADSPGVT